MSADAELSRRLEATAAFHLRMRARGVRDLAVLRAFEIVPRAAFLPERYAAYAPRDIPVPIACGQTSHEPWVLARAVEAPAVEPGQRVLEVGSGSGYVTAVLAQLAGEVLGLERFAGLAAAAQARLDRLGTGSAAIVWGDGTVPSAAAGTFERILIHGAVKSLPAGLIERLLPGGRIVGAYTGEGGQSLMCWSGALDDPDPICPCCFAPLVPGLAAAL